MPTDKFYYESFSSEIAYTSTPTNKPSIERFLLQRSECWEKPTGETIKKKKH